MCLPHWASATYTLETLYLIKRTGSLIVEPTTFLSEGEWSSFNYEMIIMTEFILDDSFCAPVTLRTLEATKER